MLPPVELIVARQVPVEFEIGFYCIFYRKTAKKWLVINTIQLDSEMHTTGELI